MRPPRPAAPPEPAAVPDRRPRVPSPARRAAAAAALLAAGFAAGSLSAGPSSAPAAAQEPVSDSTRETIKRGYNELRRAQTTLTQTGRYRPAAGGVNCFVVLAEGYDVLDSLENGRGVDPTTYVALEAGFALPEVAAKLGRAADGRLTYDDAVIRLLPQDVLRAMYAHRAETLGEAL